MPATQVGETSMPRLAGKIAWITGAGSGIGEAAALALADEGATTVLTGRTAEKLERVAARIKQQGGEAHVQPADLMNGNLTQALYCVTVALPMMRAQKDGLLVHTASIAGRLVGGFPGPIYTAAKHGVVAMSHTINQQECVNGIRSTVFLPGEVATPILDKRPNPVGPEERARMVQPEDCGDLIRYI